MTYAEKFQLFVASYLAALPDANVGLMMRIDVLKEAQRTIITDSQTSADEAALQFVLWKVGMGAKPKWIP